MYLNENNIDKIKNKFIQATALIKVLNDYANNHIIDNLLLLNYNKLYNDIFNQLLLRNNKQKLNKIKKVIVTIKNLWIEKMKLFI